MKSIQKKSGCGPGLGELPKVWGFFFNISATAEASDFKFSTQLVFAKTHRKITHRGKSGHGLGLGKLPNILGFPYNISASAEASNFKISTLVGFAKAHHKIPHLTAEEKATRPCAIGAPKILGFPFNICATAEASNFKFGMQLGHHHKTTTRGKSGGGLGLGKLVNIWGSLLIFLQRLCYPLSISGASR